MDMNPFIARRARLLSAMLAHGGGVAILATAPEMYRNSDVTYPFRYDSSFYYLSAFSEPEAVIVLVADEKPRSILFCRSKNVERETWEGFRYGPEAACEKFGFDAAFAIEQIDDELPRLIADHPTLFYALGETSIEKRVQGWRDRVRLQSRSGVVVPAASYDVRLMVDEMRLFKDASEIASMRRAAQISSKAHMRAMETCAPGRFEYEIEAELLAEFRRHGSQAPAYGSIVAGGGNACVLHYLDNDKPLKAQDLLLIDAGCELDGYASDITRTFPVNGRFEGARRDLYELVLEAQQAALDATRVGATFDEPHQAATRVLIEGMVHFGLLQGTVEAALETGSYRAFYMHRTGHWLGLDVHDVGDYRAKRDASVGKERPWRLLEAGMTLTVEPGIYVRPSDSIPQAFWDIGIRIEDDVQVTASGCDILSSDAPKTVQQIEALMAG